MSDTTLTDHHALSGGADLIADERRRQVTQEGWTTEHDDEHEDCSLIMAAVSYAFAAKAVVRGQAGWSVAPAWWPWHDDWWKPADASMIPTRNAVANLVKAGALIAAEIDRLQRMDDDADDDGQEIERGSIDGGYLDMIEAQVLAEQDETPRAEGER